MRAPSWTTGTTSTPNHVSYVLETPLDSSLPLEIAKTSSREPQHYSLRNEVYFWVNECAWPGMGLFGESYLLFSIGTLTPLWEFLFEDCLAGETCSPRLRHSLTYTVVLGVIFGMMLLGTLANTMGRRVGSILTATLMAVGAWGMTLCSFVLVDNPPLLFRSIVCFFFVFGVGVGGEYPLSASSASERAMAEMQEMREKEEEINFEYDYTELEDDLLEQTKKQTQRRGERVQLVFTMQGVGILCNCVVMTLLLLIMGQSGDQGDLQGGDNQSVSGSYNASALLGIWRTIYAIGAAVLSYVLVSRILYLQESQVWQEDKERREKQKLMLQVDISVAGDGDHQYSVEGRDDTNIFRNVSDVSSLSVPSVAPPNDETSIRMVPSTTSEEDLESSEIALLLRNYGLRLLGASASWFLWDIAFYGNKLFQASFLLALTGNETTLVEMSKAATINALVALAGYFCAATIIDTVGRVRLQQYGFLITGMLFVGCGLFYDKLPSSCLVWMYFCSSFFGQCGPNSTTFVIPAEIFPTEMRTMCHGIAAAAGKFGALFASIVFSRVQNPTNLFLWSGYASFTAAVVTFCLLPETTELNLYETDRRWRMILEGRKGDYVGQATMPKFLSFYERQRMGLNH